jgi:hypothetical protein
VFSTNTDLGIWEQRVWGLMTASGVLWPLAADDAPAGGPYAAGGACGGL